MCKLIKIDLGANWKDEIFNYSKRIRIFQMHTETDSFSIKFDYTDKGEVIKTYENSITKKKIREIVEYNKERDIRASTLFSFENNEWRKIEEKQYSYNSKKSIRYCCRQRFHENGDPVIERTETQTLKTDKFLKKIQFNRETNHQSIEEFKFDNCVREVEFLIYEVRNDELMNVLKTTNEFKDNIEIYSVFSTISKDSNEWSMTSKTITESLPKKFIRITEYFENGVLSSKEKQNKYLNSSNQIEEIITSEWTDNIWRPISKIKYDYSNEYLKRETRYSLKNNAWVSDEKTEYDNLDGFITKKICFKKHNRTWIQTSEHSYEYI